MIAQADLLALHAEAVHALKRHDEHTAERRATLLAMLQKLQHRLDWEFEYWDTQTVSGYRSSVLEERLHKVSEVKREVACAMVRRGEMHHHCTVLKGLVDS